MTDQKVDYQEDFAKLENIITIMHEHTLTLEGVPDATKETLQDFVYEVTGQVKVLLQMYDANRQYYNNTLENMSSVIDKLDASKGVKDTLKKSLPQPE